MDERQKLIKHLQNSVKKGQKSITLDTDYLLSVLQTAPDRASDTTINKPISPNIDGGNFSN